MGTVLSCLIPRARAAASVKLWQPGLSWKVLAILFIYNLFFFKWFFNLHYPWICIKFCFGEKVTLSQGRRCSWYLGLPPSNPWLWVMVTKGTIPMVHTVDPT